MPTLKGYGSRISIRQYQPNDWDAICRIHDEARILELRHGGVDKRAFRPMQDVAEQDGLFDSETLVSCIGSEIVGFVSWNDDYITWLYVDPGYHRQGVGRHLLETALDRIGSGAWTNTIPENLPALRLYESVGMQLVWTRQSHCEGYSCNTARLALPTSRMYREDATRQIGRDTALNS